MFNINSNFLYIKNIFNKQKKVWQTPKSIYCTLLLWITSSILNQDIFIIFFLFNLKSITVNRLFKVELLNYLQILGLIKKKLKYKKKNLIRNNVVTLETPNLACWYLYTMCRYNLFKILTATPFAPGKSMKSALYCCLYVFYHLSLMYMKKAE